MLIPSQRANEPLSRKRIDYFSIQYRELIEISIGVWRQEIRKKM